jgi:CheY-like chemotaxis protein
VDDEPDARDLLVSLLEQCGATVLVADSAAAALAVVPAQRPDLIISDVGMPGEDGYSLLEKVRALPSELGGQTPAIALTAYARAEDRTRALLAGFNMHVSKPIEPSELVVVVANVGGRLAGRRREGGAEKR